MVSMCRSTNNVYQNSTMLSNGFRINQKALEPNMDSNKISKLGKCMQLSSMVRQVARWHKLKYVDHHPTSVGQLSG